MSQTPHFNLDYLLPEQAQKHVTINDALRRLDGLVQLSVKSRTLPTPPHNPENGDRYLIADKPKEAWQGQAGRLALYEDTAWHFFTPQSGWRLWDAAARALVVFDGEIWQALDVAAPSSGEGGANLVRSVTSENPIGAALAQIPSHGIFLGLTAVVTQAIKGPARWSIGVDGGHDRFGNGLGVEAGTQIRGPADPSVIYWEETPIIATPERGQFTAGRLKLSIFFIDLPVPSPVPEPDDN